MNVQGEVSAYASVVVKSEFAFALSKVDLKLLPMLKTRAITTWLTCVLLSSLGYKGELDDSLLRGGVSMPLSCKFNSTFDKHHLYAKCSTVMLKFQTMF